MPPAEQSAIEAACTRLVHAFCQFSDQSDYHSYEKLFTTDARLSRPDAQLRGAAGIVAALRSRSALAAVRHVSANPLITVVDSTHARGTGTLLVYRHDRTTQVTNAPLFGDYEDEYVRTEAGWQIASRKVWFSFGPPLDSPPG